MPRIFSTLFLVICLVCPSMLTDQVLCVENNGHVQVEAKSLSCCHGEALVLAESSVLSPELHCGECRDFALDRSLDSSRTQRVPMVFPVHPEKFDLATLDKFLSFAPSSRKLVFSFASSLLTLRI